jgi:hypothetical protein
MGVQVSIDKDLHKAVKVYAALNNQKIYQFVEDAIRTKIEAMGGSDDAEEAASRMLEEQRRQSDASTEQGGPMVRFGQAQQQKEKEEEGENGEGW